ncbi:MAG: glucose-methanol-choline oxidoreductase [Edaphobacter sp.]|nr:glucose-methanol-choline oxidoreductase [Edaphobacter sp.]
MAVPRLSWSTQMRTRPRSERICRFAGTISESLAMKKNILSNWKIFGSRKLCLQRPRKHHELTTKKPQKTPVKTPTFLKTPCKNATAAVQKKNSKRRRKMVEAVGVVRGSRKPNSRGHLRLTGSDPRDPIQIEANTLSHPDDMKAAIACVELCHEIGNSAPLRPFVKREVMPGNLKGAELENLIRDAASSYWHATCSCEMGRDSMSVVDGNLRVYGIQICVSRLRLL